MSRDEIIVKLEGATKEYRLGDGSSIKAVNNVDLCIRRGDRLGIVGKNGSGKTTLLKLISSIAKPSKGEVVSNGKIVSLMNLEDGFNLDLTGRENVQINGLLVGMSSAEINRKMEEIIEMSGIGKFVDEPFHTYSAGMKFRLAFSVAIAASCDLLIVDELMVSGDVDFQAKVLKVLDGLCQDKKIATVFCSHVPSFIWRFSDSFWKMDKGKISQVSKTQMKEMIIEHENLWKKNLGLEEIF